MVEQTGRQGKKEILGQGQSCLKSVGNLNAIMYFGPNF